MKNAAIYYFLDESKERASNETVIIFLLEVFFTHSGVRKKISTFRKLMIIKDKVYLE
jgi:hypothetical protein